MSEQEEGLTSVAKEDHKITTESADWLSDKLSEAIDLVSKASEKIEIVDDEGNKKIYTPVAIRNAIFRKVFGVRGRIMTRPREGSDKEVVMESVIDFLMDGKYVRYANAFAGKTKYEMAQAQTGKSMIQLAETASIGRALANIGLSGGEFASLEDLVDYKSEKISTDNMVATKKQIELIQEKLKLKNLKIEKDFPMIEDLNKISYKRATDLISEIDETDEKKTTQRKTRVQSKNPKVNAKSTAASKTERQTVSSKKTTESKNQKSDKEPDGELF